MRAESCADGERRRGDARDSATTNSARIGSETVLRDATCVCDGWTGRKRCESDEVYGKKHKTRQSEPRRESNRDPRDRTREPGAGHADGNRTPLTTQPQRSGASHHGSTLSLDVTLTGCNCAAQSSPSDESRLSRRPKFGSSRCSSASSRHRAARSPLSSCIESWL